MLKKHKNRFIEIIQGNGLRPDNFKSISNDEEEGADFILEYINSPLRFEVFCSNRSYNLFDCKRTLLAKGFPLSDFFMGEGVFDYTEIDTIYEIFKTWLEEVVKEYIDEQSLPDLWKQLEQQREFIPSAKMEKDDTLPYSDEEKTQLRLSINEFRLQIISNFKPDDDQMKVVDDRLNYLSEALDRLNRIDWKSVALSSLIAISTALSLDTQKGQQLFDLFKQVFSQVIHLLK
ncbi:MAG: hypothetical protein ACW98W_20145 [Candidatus Hodarchaeales archaeon]|jgi:hypothetical protein